MKKALRVATLYNIASPRQPEMICQFRLYREDASLVWRIDGPLGDPVEIADETIQTPANAGIAHACLALLAIRQTLPRLTALEHNWRGIEK